MSLDLAAIQQWIDNDPSSSDRAELTELLRAATTSGPQQESATAELADRFRGPLTFGTAGLRGRLGAGPNRMNRAVVIRTAAGLCAFLKNLVGADFSVVIGYDARYGSAQFAEDTAAVVTAAGGKAQIFPRALPTPLTAFALRYLEVDAAVMVTASHNPPQDNGYKVYLGGRAVSDSGQGVQIVSPYDTQILEAIAQSPAPAAVPRATGGWTVLDNTVEEAYLTTVAALAPPGLKDLRIVFTAMHGVGGEPALAALRRAGFHDVHTVAAQQLPDPDFPTVAFPNPEEPGALDLAISLAQEIAADLVIANDPDADRCSAAVPDPTADSGWRQLSGDEIGALLGEEIAAAYAAANSSEGSPGSRAVMASSIVSSRLLSQIAARHSLQYRATLTGFKWIARVADLIFGYEEAIGFCVDPAHVRDKDGISAAVRLCLLGQAQKDRGETLLHKLDELAEIYGLYLTKPLSIRVEDPAIIARAMQNLREQAPVSLAGSAVVETTDLANGSAELPPTEGLVFLTAANDRVVVRPSGTEPKLKCYLEVILPVDDTITVVRQRAADRLQQISDEMRAALGLLRESR